MRCTAIRKAGSFAATTMATATCRSMCSVVGTFLRPSCGEVNRRLGRVAAEGGADLQADPCPHPAAGRLRLRPRDADGLVRRQRRGLRVRLARNERLVREIEAELAAAEVESRWMGRPAPPQGLQWTTLDSWSRRRRGVARRNGRTAKPTPASSSPHSATGRSGHGLSTRGSTARTARWRC